MTNILTTDIFDTWFDSLEDRQAANRIKAQIDQAEDGSFGDGSAVGEGISEIRIHYGPEIMECISYSVV